MVTYSWGMCRGKVTCIAVRQTEPASEAVPETRTSESSLFWRHRKLWSWVGGRREGGQLTQGRRPELIPRGAGEGCGPVPQRCPSRVLRGWSWQANARPFRKEVPVLVLGCGWRAPRREGPGTWAASGALATAGLFPVRKPLGGLGPVVSAIHSVCHWHGRVFYCHFLHLCPNLQ